MNVIIMFITYVSLNYLGDYFINLRHMSMTDL